MESLIDFTNCRIDNSYIYSGANGKKIGIEYNNKIYMLKFPSFESNIDAYADNCISEYLSCKILKELGFNVQNTILGKYIYDNKEKIVCACEDFTVGGFELKEFASLKNSVINSENNGYGTELSDVLETIEKQTLIRSEVMNKFFFELFIADALLGNFDRHNGNWGVLLNRKRNEFKIAPIYDCGSCLYPQLTDENIKEIMKDEGEINKRVYIFPNSALKIKDKKINYHDYINSLENDDCNKALMEIFPKININRINEIIDSIPCITDIRKEFYKLMISKRYENILKKAYEKLCKRR